MSDGPTCFLHIPKSAGTSLHVALEAAFPLGSVAPRRMDPAAFCRFDNFDRLGDEARAVVAADEGDLAELARYRVVSGHFALSSLEQFASATRIGTVLREPRARLMSHYLYLRMTPRIREVWHPYDTFSPADGALREFLSDARIATATDNKTCRMLLHGDPRVRDGEFLAEPDLGGIADAAWGQLLRLGFVGLLELGADAWRGIGGLVGEVLKPAQANVTGEKGARRDALPIPPFEDDATLRLLGQRTAADAVLYHRIAARRLGGPHAARRFAEEAFAAQVARLRTLTEASRLGSETPAPESAFIEEHAW